MSSCEQARTPKPPPPWNTWDTGATNPFDPRAPLHRFTRPDGHVDLMAPENRAVRFAGRDVVRVPGARSALEFTTTFQTPGGTTIRIPDIASAVPCWPYAGTGRLVLSRSHVLRRQVGGAGDLACWAGEYLWAAVGS